MRSARWLSAVLTLTAASPILAGCGSSGTAAGSAVTTIPPPASSTPTSTPGSSRASASTLAPTSLAVRYGQDACRAFESFAAILTGQAEDGATAVGEIGGMVADASEAQAASGDQRWARLKSHLTALQAVAGSKQWPLDTSADRLPQVRLVASDCRPIGVG